MKQYQINTLDLLLVLSRHKRTILIICVSFALASALISLVLPKYYVASSVILPSQESSGSLASLMRGLPMSGLMGSLGDPSEDYYLSILYSERLRQEMIDTFNLATHYEFGVGDYFREDLLTTLEENIYITQETYGTIRVGFGAKEPKLASDIANFMVRRLDRISAELSTKHARYRRLFLEDRRAIAEESLKKAENALRDFQKENGAILVTQQASATLNAAAGLEAQFLQTNIQLELASKEYSDLHPHVLGLKKKLNVLKTQLRSLSQKRESDFMIPLNEAPDLTLEFVRLKRDLTVQELVYEYIVQQHEEAKVEEAKNTPVIQVLDRAAIPEKRAAPKRKKIVLVSLLVAALLSTIVVATMEVVERSRNSHSENYSKFRRLIKSIRKW